mgnify:CR=1 FL=1
MKVSNVPKYDVDGIAAPPASSLTKQSHPNCSRNRIIYSIMARRWKKRENATPMKINNDSNRSNRSVRFSAAMNHSDYGDGSSAAALYKENISSCNDDVSSLHFDEYGYDISNERAIGDGDDDSDIVSEFFKAPTRRELSAELFKLVEPNGSVFDSLQSLQCE